jgi:hypothetical protein
MQTQPISRTLFVPRRQTLHGIVGQMINDAAPLAIHNRNSVVNNVPTDLRVEGNGILIASVLDKLLRTVIRNMHNSGILISARIYGTFILIQVKSKGNISPALPDDIAKASLNAQKTGGVIEMVHYENKEASVAYCFLNVAGKA